MHGVDGYPELERRAWMTMLPGRTLPRRSLSLCLRRRIIYRVALRIDGLASALRAIGRQKAAKIGQPRVAVFGHKPGDAVAALALARDAREPQGWADQVREGYGALAGQSEEAIDLQGEPQLRLCLYVRDVGTIGGGFVKQASGVAPHVSASMGNGNRKH